MSKLEESNNFIRTICTSCEVKKILVAKKFEYNFNDLTCDECKMSRDMDRAALDSSIFTNSQIYCPGMCGMRCTPQKLKAHENDCRKRSCRYRCMFGNCASVEPIQEFIKHVQREHSENFIVMDLCPEFKFSVSRSENKKLIVLHNTDYIENEVYLLSIFTQRSDTFLGIKHLCSFKGKFHTNRITFTQFTATSEELAILGSVGYFSSRTNFWRNPKALKVAHIAKGDIMLTMLDSSAQQLSEELLSEFECDVCSEILFPPIRLCNAGHSLCDHCFKQVVKCPKCQAGLSQGRNYALERIVNKINIRCKYSDAGCKEEPKADDFKNHISECWFRPYTCINCKKLMCYKDIWEHADCLGTAELGVDYSIIDTGASYSVKSTFTFLVFDELFILRIDKSGSSGNSSDPYIMLFSLENFTMMSNIQYYFELTVSEPTDNKSVAFTCECGQNASIGVPKNYFKPGRNLNFRLSIYQRA